MAYTHSDIRGEGSGCAIWFGNLIDIRVYPSSGQDSYIRMQHTEQGLDLILSQRIIIYNHTVINQLILCPKQVDIVLLRV